MAAVSKYAKYANYVVTGRIDGPNEEDEAEAEVGEENGEDNGNEESMPRSPVKRKPLATGLGDGSNDATNITYDTQETLRGTNLLRNRCTCKSSVASKCPIHSPSGSGENARDGNGTSASQKKQCHSMAHMTNDLSRTSLLGRPLKVETHHRDLRYRKKQNIIYNFLERPRGWRAALYHFLL